MPSSDRPLAGEWPYLWLDATYLKQREGGRIVSVAAIIAVAVNTDGKREIATTPRSARSSSTSRRLRLNTWYNRTACLMISAGKRWR